MELSTICAQFWAQLGRTKFVQFCSGGHFPDLGICPGCCIVPIWDFATLVPFRQFCGLKHRCDIWPIWPFVPCSHLTGLGFCEGDIFRGVEFVPFSFVPSTERFSICHGAVMVSIWTGAGLFLHLSRRRDGFHLHRRRSISNSGISGLSNSALSDFQTAQFAHYQTRALPDFGKSTITSAKRWRR